MVTITVQRVARHKDGWKMRFIESRAGLITTVLVPTKFAEEGGEVDLDFALKVGADAADTNFNAMSAFNDRQTRAASSQLHRPATQYPRGAV